MHIDQSKLLDLEYELVEDNINMTDNKEKNQVGRPKKIKVDNKNKKITDYINNAMNLE